MSYAATCFRQRGVTYLLTLFAVAALGFGMAGLGRVWSTAAQREREIELIFAGGEIARAIASYRAASPADRPEYPRTLDDLLLDPRVPFVRRHLRKLYRDPMSGEADWILERVGGGIVAVRSRSTRPVLRSAGLPAWIQVEGSGEGTRHTDWVFRADEPRAPPVPPGRGR